MVLVNTVSEIEQKWFTGLLNTYQAFFSEKKHISISVLKWNCMLSYLAFTYFIGNKS